jgi:hypothetical protein
MFVLKGGFEREGESKYILVDDRLVVHTFASISTIYTK